MNGKKNFNMKHISKEECNFRDNKNHCNNLSHIFGEFVNYNRNESEDEYWNELF